MCVGQYAHLCVCVCCGDYILHFGVRIVFLFLRCCTSDDNISPSLMIWRALKIFHQGDITFRFSCLRVGVRVPMPAPKVGANFVSLAPTFLQKSERAHAVAPPPQSNPLRWASIWLFLTSASPLFDTADAYDRIAKSRASPHNCVCGLRPIFCPIRAVIKGGNTYSIPALL